MKTISFARELHAGRTPRREILRLGDGYETSVLVHQPVGPVKLPVLYMHGIQSHPGWFVGSAAVLAEAGHPVFQVTRRGSGDNIAARGHAESADQLLDDIEAACRFVLESSRADRLHLLGVSWGGKLLAAYTGLRKNCGHIASLTAVAPGIVAKVDVGLSTKLAVALALLVSPYRRFPLPLNDVELFTDNEQMREYLRRDRCRLMDATARFLFGSRRLDAMLRSAKTGSISVPCALLLASDDRIINNVSTARLMRRLTGGRMTLQQIAGCHTLEFEPDPAVLYEALIAATADHG